MLVSILHRATGTAMAIGGGLIFTWWLVAAASSPKAYALFYAWVVEASPDSSAQGVVNALAKLVGIGLSWAFFQHMASGVRHLFMDVGAAYELKVNKAAAVATLIFSTVATILFWAWIFVGKY